MSHVPSQQKSEDTAIRAPKAPNNNLKKLWQRCDWLFRISAWIFIVSGFAICLYNVPAFREQAQRQGAFTVPFDSLYSCLFGFLFHYLGRKALFGLTSEWFRGRLHPKVRYYTQEQRRERLVVIVKQTYEGIFHLSATIFNLYLTINESWMPNWIGGSGTCDSIFMTYPQWPERDEQVLWFYQFQLGTYLYQIMDLVLLDRERYLSRNFGELFYHHCVAILLISFSLLYNFVPIGLTMLLVHDGSDWMRGFSYVIGNSRACITYPQMGLMANVAYVILFGYLRLGVLPFCLLESFDEGNPSTNTDTWSFLYPQCLYLTVLSCAIYCIQCYWGYFIFFKVKQEHERNQYFIKEYQGAVGKDVIKKQE